MCNNFVDYIDKIIECSSICFDRGGKEYHIVGDKLINVWVDENGNYLNGMQYRTIDDKLWSWTKPEQYYYEHICNNGKFKFDVYDIRYYGNPKLSKPSELRGVKPSFTVDYIEGKCKCQAFIKGNDVWLKHRDYFSQSIRNKEDLGAPLDVMVGKYTDKTKKKKFIYGDAWGDIVLRNEAWIVLKNVVNRIGRDLELDALSMIIDGQERYHDMKQGELLCSDMERMWESVIKGVREELINGNYSI